MSNRVFDKTGQDQLKSVFAHLLVNMYCAVFISISFNILIWQSMSGFPPELQYFDFVSTCVLTVSFLLPTVMFTITYFQYARVFRNISEMARRR